MKIAIFSDIHANLSAFSAVKEHCRTTYGKIPIVHLGDIIDYGLRPNEVIESLAELSDDILINIQGNHEHCLLDNGVERFSSNRGRAAHEFTRSILAAESVAYINTMDMGPCEFEMDGKKVLCVHGSLEDLYWGKITEGEIGAEVYQRYDVVFSGHTHIPHLKYHVDRGHGDHVLFLNPGSIGQPRNYDTNAQYAIWDSVNNQVFFEHVAYDLSEELRLYIGQVDDFYRERLISGI